MPAPLKHLALNAVFMQAEMGGIVTYVRNLIAELVLVRPDLRISVFVSARAAASLEQEPWADSVDLLTHRWLGRTYASALSELTLLKYLVERTDADVMHSLSMTGPMGLAIPHVVTVPDLVWLRFQSSGRATVLLWKALVPAIARRADRVITISRASAQDIQRHLRVPAALIDVIPLGPGAEPPAQPTPAEHMRAALAIATGPVVLSVSSKNPHKNLMRLVQAMAHVRTSVPSATLVVPGRPTSHELELQRECQRLGVEARFPGFLSPEDLEGLYGLADCFVYPSLHEGFGLPVLEAMRRGVPVACSRASAMPEVAGGAARYFDPRDASDLAAAIRDVLMDAELARDLVAHGRQRAKTFTWRATAEMHLESYERALAESSA